MKKIAQLIHPFYTQKTELKTLEILSLNYLKLGLKLY